MCSIYICRATNNPTRSFLSGPNVIVKFSKMFEDCGKKATNEDVILAVNSHYDRVSREGGTWNMDAQLWFYISYILRNETNISKYFFSP